MVDSKSFISIDYDIILYMKKLKICFIHLHSYAFVGLFFNNNNNSAVYCFLVDLDAVNAYLNAF
jgi:hypothetical protein